MPQKLCHIQKYNYLMWQGHYIRKELKWFNLRDIEQIHEGPIHFYHYQFITLLKLSVPSRQTPKAFEFAMNCRKLLKAASPIPSSYWLTQFFDQHLTLLKSGRQPLAAFLKSFMQIRKCVNQWEVRYKNSKENSPVAIFCFGQIQQQLV